MIYNIVTFLNTTMTNSSSTVTTEDGGRQNMFAAEPQIEVMDVDQSKQAELTNGRWAMIGFVAAIGAYVTTGQIEGGLTMLENSSLYAVSSNDAVYRFDSNLNFYYNLNIKTYIVDFQTYCNQSQYIFFLFHLIFFLLLKDTSKIFSQILLQNKYLLY